MKHKMLTLTLLCSILLVGCNLPSPVAPTLTPTDPAQPILVFETTETPTSTPIEMFTPVSADRATPIPPVAQNVCNDPQVTTLIDSFKQAMLTEDGKLLSSVVSPGGMEVRFFRNGNPINYLPDQARFLFTTTYQANWGLEPASGLPKNGSFHDVVVPELIKIFNQPYTIHCNEIRHGGATYEVQWPYNKDFYSIYYTGTEVNGFLDWHTWVVGVEYVNGKPRLYALMQFFWEP